MANKNFNAKEIIFTQGDKADCMFDIVKGSVGIYLYYGKENETLLTTLQAGSYFGEMGMIDNKPRSATAVAVEDGTELEVITAENFSEYFQEKPVVVMQIMRNMSKRIRELTNDYMEACRAIVENVENEKDTGKRKTLKERFKKFIDDYAEASKLLAESGYSIDMQYHGGFWL